jgi:hypothetical protein
VSGSSMTTRDIRTHYAHTVCDVCGRTLLRGEQAETYISGGARRSVCELCKARALHEGWVREGTLPDYGEMTQGTERRRSLLGRLGSRRRDAPGRRAPTLDDELAGPAWEAGATEPVPAPPPVPAPRTRETRAAREPRARGTRRSRVREVAEVREPRQVRAVPSSADQKIVAAIDCFNASEHRRTVAGVARSLGGPTVSVLPEPVRPSVVRIVVSWELCWYRYELDLSEQVPTVRVDGQGYELGDLTLPELTGNALADESGQLMLT